MEVFVKSATFCAIVLILGCGLVFGQTYNVLYTFGSNPSDGFSPSGHLVADRAGDLYGITAGGGAYGAGTAFELSPNPDGSWSEKTLYSFCYYYFGGYCPSGGGPTGTLVLDTEGNVYGTTGFGGIQPCAAQGTAGCGVAFKLSPPGVTGGYWTYTVLYLFCSISDCEDGAVPSPLTFDKNGNLYGTTQEGVESGNVFELSLGSSGWTESVLYNFCSLASCLDGRDPVAAVTFDKTGNLYGTTEFGGTTDSGVLYRLSQGSGGWSETVFYEFPVPHGSQPFNFPGTVSIDPTGTMYTTLAPFFELGDPENGGIISVKITGSHRMFWFNGTDGQGPETGVLLDNSRKIAYGTTVHANGYGNVFQISRGGQEKVLYNFCQQASCTDGYYPQGLIEDKSGKLYGEAYFGGINNQGVVFKIIP